ncbi:hypothetical protein EDD86DRAFT_13948 [Gorgonomyces haynaldii]|nr:hypothetical protein EDD86DRAFT_13948 [Gorgonomyces haynaldii]
MLFIQFVNAQSCSNANPTYDACVTNGMTQPNGMVGPRDPYGACASLAADQAKYYDCLCFKFGVLYQCFNSFCPNDGASVSVAQAQTQFCQAALANPVTSNYNVWSATAVAAATSTAVLQQTTTPTPSNAAKSSAWRDTVDLGIVFAIAFAMN